MGKTVVLWDIDKTITDSGGLPDLFRTVLEELLGHAHEASLPNKDGKTDSQIAQAYLEAAGLDGSLLGDFMCRLESLSAEFFLYTSLGQVPGVADALLLLKKAGVVNGLYTGNTPQRALMKLEAAALNPQKLFDAAALYCLGYEANRFEGVEAVKRAHPDARLIVMGDAPSDLEVARRLEVPFWHVGKGYTLTYERMLGESTDFTGDALLRFVGEVSRYGSEND